MKSKLIKYRVQKFRSIEDSGWIETEKVGCLVKTKESEKIFEQTKWNKIKNDNEESTFEEENGTRLVVSDHGKVRHIPAKDIGETITYAK